MATAEYTLTKAPYFLQVATGTPLYYSAEDFRAFTAAFQQRSGVLGPSDFKVSQATDIGWSIAVIRGHVNIDRLYSNGSTMDNQNYVVHMPANADPILIPWRPPGTGTRTHKVFIAVFDPLVQGNATEAKIIISEDVGSGAPKPVGAAGYLQLATITMTAGQPNIQTKDITNTARHGGNGSNDILYSPYLGAAYQEVGTDGATSYPFTGRYEDGVMRLSGGVEKKDHTAISSATDIVLGTPPPDLIPARDQFLTGVCTKNASGATGTMSWQCCITANGLIIARMPNTNAPLRLYFDGIAYDLD